MGTIQRAAQRDPVTVFWTKSRIIMAIKAWAEMHGGPPTSRDWSVPPDDDCPPTCVVQRRFGSWNAGIAAAGLAARQAPQGDSTRLGPQFKVELTLPADIHAGLSSAAERMGVPATVLIRDALTHYLSSGQPGARWIEAKDGVDD